jgi:hypothetical protein
MSRKSSEVLAEYDFSGKKGVRGKYAKAYKSGYSVRIFDGKKLISDEFFAAIEPEVRKHFPTSSAINEALRKMIPTTEN